MASSMLTGDRRWAPTRKSGMTVLGKVPKPLNLPSQRLENHGLDPNVEIVPKGTLTWGSRPSSATPNAWGTSNVLSPNAEGSSGSPSHVSGRPSSGSGTRPSTAGSDRSHEPISSAWGPNSRPSSASGILASSQSSPTAARPRSAETRPGSSQLSRFADNPVDSTGAWGAAGTAERLGTVSSKTSGFTLSSGDFPSLGSEKNSDSHSQRGHSSQGRPNSSQGRPALVSGTDSEQKEEAQLAGNRNVDPSDHGIVDTWKADNPPYAGHGPPPNMEDWHRDPRQTQPYPNMNMPPPPYDSWHNPPYHPADGPWYRGGAAGPYRPHGPPGSYPIDYVPVRPFPRRDGDPGGYFPNNYEPYRPHMPPDRYMGPSHTDMPVRPGPYSSPAPYEGYYGPARPHFYSSSNGEPPLMGMARPVVHNQFPTQHPNFDARNFHARPGGYTPIVNKEQMKTDQVHDTQGQYRVLLKQQDGPDNLRVLSHEDQGIKSKSPDKPAPPSLMPGESVSSQSSHMDGQSTDAVVRNLVEDSSKASDVGLLRTPEAVNTCKRGPQQYPAIKRNATLMEKVEGLNTRARMADTQGEGRWPFPSKDKTKSFKGAADKELNALKEDANQESTTREKFLSGPSNLVGVSENVHSVGQKITHGAKGVDNEGKSRSNWHDNDERNKKTPGSESVIISTRTLRSSVSGAPESDTSKEASDKQELRHTASLEDGSQTSSLLDPDDYKIQRSKIKEKAKQRQLEEEERVREQKAKALAKLEELNRRTLAESSTQRTSNSPPQRSDSLDTEQESRPNEAPKSDTNSIEASTGTSADSTLKTGNPSDSFSNVSLQISNSTPLLDTPPAKSLSIEAAKITPGTTTDIQDNTISKQKQVGYRRKQSIPQENSTSEKQTNSGSTGSPKDTGEVSVHASPNHEDPSVNNRRKNSRCVKHHKNKLDEGLKSSTLSSLPDTEGSSEIGKTKSLVEAEVSTVPSESLNSEEIPNVPMTRGLLETTEGTPSKSHNHAKSHTQKKPARNQQLNRPISKYHGTEVVTWAPVKPASKTEPHEVTQITVSEAANPSGNSGTKAKRAEIERYVPKPVAKELLQQVNFQQTSPCIGEMTGVENVKLDEEIVGKSVTASDIRNVESVKHNKHGRPNASWRQRSSVEHPVTSDQARSIQKAEPLNTNSLPEGQSTNPDDGWNDTNDNLPPSETLSSNVVAKSYGGGKQKRQPYKAQRVLLGSNHPTSDTNLDSQQRIANKTEQQSQKLGRNESEIRNVVRNESQSGGSEHVKSHWQPKSQVHNHSRQGIKEINDAGNEHTQEAPRESKVITGSSKETSIELATPNSTYEHDQAIPLGVNQRRQYNGHFKQNFHVHGDKRKNNTQHMEYQQTESFNKHKDSFQRTPGGGEGVHEATWAPGSRYRERGRQYTRGGGHFNGRSMGPASRVGDSYNGGK